MQQGKMSLEQMKMAVLVVFAIAMGVALKAMGSGNSMSRMPAAVTPRVTIESLLIGADKVEYTISFAQDGPVVGESIKVLAAASLANRINSDVIVRGFALTPSKSDADDLALADDRAAQIAVWLEGLGTKSDRIHPVGMGRAGLPLWEDNPTTDRLAQCQKVEILVIPRGE